MAERKVYRTMQGKEIDMSSLISKNETMPAVGNVRMNARGDELGPGGIVVRKREDVVNQYYNQQEPFKTSASKVENTSSPEPTVTETTTRKRKESQELPKQENQ